MIEKIGVLFVILLVILFLFGCTTQEKSVTEKQQEEATMKLTSPAFKNNEKIQSKYTCDGENINPPLTISNVPQGAKSLVLIMDDPDAVKPAGKVWDHWIVWNIPPDTKEIAAGQEPLGVHGKGTSGNLKYKGPCPPDAEHRYYFKLFALDAQLELSEGATKEEVEKAMERHIIAKSELMGRYERRFSK